jgi:hypothetical protein
MLSFRSMLIWNDCNWICLFCFHLLLRKFFYLLKILSVSDTNFNGTSIFLIRCVFCEICVNKLLGISLPNRQKKKLSRIRNFVWELLKANKKVYLIPQSEKNKETYEIIRQSLQALPKNIKKLSKHHINQSK